MTGASTISSRPDERALQSRTGTQSHQHCRAKAAASSGAGNCGFWGAPRDVAVQAVPWAQGAGDQRPSLGMSRTNTEFQAGLTFSS